MMITSGAAHAIVNAILKSGGDKMSSRALIDGSAALIILPGVFFVPLPHGAWMWLFGSWFTHVIYLFALVKSFEATDMTVAYPITRGLAPAVAAAAAVTLMHEPISLATAAGIGLVSCGVLTVGLGRHIPRRALAWAGLTGVTIAAYTVIDAAGVRAAPSAPSYIVWEFITLGFGIALIFSLIRGPRFVIEARSQWKPGLAAGFLSIITWGLALTAYRMGDVPRLAALRETSILFGVIIAIVFLKERVTLPRLGGIGAIAAGAMVLLATG